MTTQAAIDLTAIMQDEGIRQITRLSMGFQVILSHNGGIIGHGNTVGEALADAQAQVRRAA